jgi:hypothetical protein
MVAGWTFRGKRLQIGESDGRSEVPVPLRPDPRPERFDVGEVSGTSLVLRLGGSSSSPDRTRSPRMGA